MILVIIHPSTSNVLYGISKKEIEDQTLKMDYYHVEHIGAFTNKKGPVEADPFLKS